MDTELILKNVSRFITLTDEERDYFVSIMRPRTYRKRQYVVQAGDVCKYENFVTKGCLRSYFVDDNGFEHILQFAIEDWWIGDMASFITQTPAMLNVEAVEDTELIQILKADLDALFDKYPKFDRFYRELIQKSMVTQQKRILSNISLTAEQRYLAFRSQYAFLEQRLPQNYIASYLGITPEFLSKIRKKIATHS